jgi:hypothetical protein
MAYGYNSFNAPQDTLRREQNEDELRTQRIAQMTPEQRNAYIAASGGQLLGRGIGQAVGGALGVDTRNATQRDAAGAEAAKNEIAALDIDPGDVEKYYPAAIRIFIKHRMLDEAEAWQQKFQAARAAKQRTDNTAAETARKTAKDAATKKFLEDKIQTLKGGTLEGKTAAYEELLNRINDPEEQQDINTLQNIKTAYERSLGIKDSKPGLKVAKGGAYHQGDDGNWKFVANGMGGGSGSGSGAGGVGKTEKERTRTRTLALERMERAGTLGEDDAAELNAIREERAGKAKQPSDLEVRGAGAMGQLESLQKRFDRSFVGGIYRFAPEGVNDAIAEAADRMGKNQDENAWWSSFNTWYNNMLNALSGAAVTANEAERFKKTIIRRGMDPATAESRMAEMIEIAKIGLQKQAEARQPQVKRAVPSAPQPTKRRRFNPATGALE